MTITTRLFTYFHGKLIGEDAFGNRYYTEKNPPRPGSKNARREKRWVMYKGMAEPSKVPPEWHGWLHYTFPTPPTQRTTSHYAWQKPHQPNLTGTKGAYVPPGHLLRSGQHEATTADYQAWNPDAK